MHLLFKVYTVDSESALSEYIPFASTKIVDFDDSNISSELHANILSCLNRLNKKVLLFFYILFALLVNSAFYCSVTCCLPTSCLLYCMKLSGKTRHGGQFGVRYKGEVGTFGMPTEGNRD